MLAYDQCIVLKLFFIDVQSEKHSVAIRTIHFRLPQTVKVNSESLKSSEKVSTAMKKVKCCCQEACKAANWYTAEAFQAAPKRFQKLPKASKRSYDDLEETKKGSMRNQNYLLEPSRCFKYFKNLSQTLRVAWPSGPAEATSKAITAHQSVASRLTFVWTDIANRMTEFR